MYATIHQHKILTEDDIPDLQKWESTNLLTDDEMNLSNANMSNAAKSAISNVNYANGTNKFHYYGVSDYERCIMAFHVQPNRNYKFNCYFNVNLPALDSTFPYLPCWIDNLNNTKANDETYTKYLAFTHVPIPVKGNYQIKLDFNSLTNSLVYFHFNLGFFMDGIATDITLGNLSLQEAYPTWNDIENLQEQINQLKNSK